MRRARRSDAAAVFDRAAPEHERAELGALRSDNARLLRCGTCAAPLSLAATLGICSDSWQAAGLARSAAPWRTPRLDCSCTLQTVCHKRSFFKDG